MEKRLFNIDELSTYLAVPRGTIYNWISQKKLPYVKIGRRVKFDKEDIDKMINEKKVLAYKGT
jgi:excisionase family DNA binding protein